MADAYNDLTSRSINPLSSGRGGRGHTPGRSGWRGYGSGERGNERSRGRAITRGSRSTWRSSARGGRNAPSPDPFEGQPTGDLLKTITLTNLQPSTLLKDKTLTITDCRNVASYNWVDSQMATVLVPGAPPAWCPPQNPPKLEQDKGTYLRDPNAARYPRFPIEPAIRAVFALHHDFDTTAIDVVGCGSTLGNLMRLANSYDASFRFYVELVGNTVFLIRKGKSPTELIEGVRGYGHTFPEAYTSWDADVKNSVSHQRIIQYNFGGLKCLVRYEGDGYLKDHVKSKSQQLPKSPTLLDLLSSLSEDSPDSLGLAQGDEMQSLLQAAGSITVGEKISSNTTNLTIKSAGQEVPQSAVFDLKTRYARREIDMEEVYPRLWVSQIRKFIIAYNDAGIFNDIRVQDLGESVHDWEKKNQGLLHRFKDVLRQLIGFVKQSQWQKVEVRRIGTGPLQIRKQDEKGWNALPPDLKARWSGRPIDEFLDVGGLDSAKEETTGDTSGGSEDGGLDDYLRF